MYNFVNKRIKKIVSLHLVFMLLFSSFLWNLGPTTSYSEENNKKVIASDQTEFMIELVNPEINSNGDAARPADTLTLFTRDFEDETTRTNAWGVEVAVQDGVVTYVSDTFSGNNPIPLNGFVISIIDSGGTTLRDELRNAFSVGDEVELFGVELPEEDTSDEPIEEFKGIELVEGTESIAVQGMDIEAPEDETVLYSAEYTYNTTKRDEAIELTIIDGKITNITENGNSTIPLDGYVVSTTDKEATASFNVGDQVTLTGYSPYTDALGAATNQDGKRLLIQRQNVSRSTEAVFIYTADYGSSTQTNQWGTEMAVDLDENGELKVTHFRALGEGDHSGTEIPRWGFVLSAFGEPYRDYLMEGNIFNIDDTVTLEGISLIELDREVSFEYAAINPTAETNPGGVADEQNGETFPGVRGADQLIVYTPEWETETTGTNEYGFEVRVSGSLENGTIVSRGGNNTTIPEDGYVLSGHGDGASFLLGNAVIGASVLVNEETKRVTIKTTPDSIIQRKEALLVDAQQQFDNAKSGLYDVDIDGAYEALSIANETFEAAIAKLEEANAAGEGENFLLLVEFLDLLDQSEHHSNLVYYRTLESKPVEGRAIWHRPTEKNLEEVQNNLDELADSNFNLLFIETWNNGYSIFPSSNELIELQPRIKDYTYGEYSDILEAYVEEGKKRGIEVHAWVQNFRVGSSWITPHSPIIEQKPEWALIHYDGGILTPNENSYVFMDPAIPAVQEFLIEYYKEMVEKYDIQGFQLDYIRYPVGRYLSDSGYGDYSVQAFKELYDIPESADIKEVTDREKNPEMWNKWNKWKESNITNFVGEVASQLKELDQELILSTAIFENLDDAIGTKQQNWPEWVQNGWIDLTNPMAYYRDAGTVAQSVYSMVDRVNNMALNYAGIAPSFMGLANRTNAEQTRATQLGKAQGSAIFASQNFLGLTAIQEVFQESTYRNAAVLPHGDLATVLQVGVEDIISKVERLYIPSGQMTMGGKQAIAQQLTSIEAMPTDTSKQLSTISNKLYLLSETSDSFASDQASERLAENLHYLAQIIEIRANRAAMSEGVIFTTPHVENNRAQVAQQVINQLKNNGVLQLDLTEILETDVAVSFEKDQIQSLKTKNVSIGFNRSNGSFSISANEFSGEQDVELHMNELKDVEGAVSSVFKFTVQQGTETISEFTQPVTLTFNVNSQKVTDSTLLSVFYYNEANDEWEEIGGSYANGIVTAQTDHFSTFAVFETSATNEEEESNDDSNNDTTDPQDGSKDGSNDDSNDQQGESEDESKDEVDEGTSTDSSNNEEANDETDESNGNKSSESKDETTDETKNKGKGDTTLPDTATNSYNLLFIGLVLTLLGGMILFFKRKSLIRE